MPIPKASELPPDDADAINVELMLRVKQGGKQAEAAFQQLIELHQKAVIGTVAKMLGNPTEAEDIALHDLVQHLLWVQGIYDSLGVNYEKSGVIHDDNEACIKLNSAPIVNFSGRSKYISRKYFSVYEHVEGGKVILRWCGTDDMIADFLTKAIIGNKFAKFRIQIMGHSAGEGISQDFPNSL